MVFQCQPDEQIYDELRDATPVGLCHASLNSSANVILVCNSLDAGGIERVVSTLANAWNRQGRKICVVTLHDRRRFYSLDPGVDHVIVDRAQVTWFVELLKRLKSRIEEIRVALAAALRRLTNDHELRTRLGKAARERVAQYALPRALATWESVIGLSSSPACEAKVTEEFCRA